MSSQQVPDSLVRVVFHDVAENGTAVLNIGVSGAHCQLYGTVRVTFYIDV